MPPPYVTPYLRPTSEITNEAGRSLITSGRGTTVAINVRDIQSHSEGRVPETDESAQANQRAWLLRGAGAVLLVAGWFVVSFVAVGGSALFINAVVFGSLGAYAFVAAAFSRRSSVDEEKRLRMDLLVHNMELEKLASKDDLTQLYNRRYFVERLDRELETARGFNRPVSLLLIDIDGMTALNGEHGHRIGDKVLTGFGRFLLAQTRASDLPARIDGDQFAVILPDTAEGGVDIMIDRLSKALEGTPLFEDGDRAIEVSVSLGVSTFPGADSADAMLQQAEGAWNANKQAKQSRADATVSAIHYTAEETGQVQGERVE